ncbi:MAG: NAD-dependent epimerase/dehydratase family protein [Pseudomonadota bacterium]
MYRNKKVLVAGGTGTIGIPLVERLIDAGADVLVVSMDDPGYARVVLNPGARFEQADLTDFSRCLEATQSRDYVFNLVGIKGSVGIGQSKAASYLYPMLMFQSNLMEAAFRNNVARFLFVSSICAYPESSLPKQEDSLWNGMPKQNDRIPGLAKRIGEVQAEAYLLEHDWDGAVVVRPSNVFGPYDDFDPATAQVIPALISRMVGGENPVKVWGDGSAERDFIYSEECAYWIMEALEKAPAATPINLGCGRPISIRETAETIAAHMPDQPVIEWDADKPAGDQTRVLDMARAKELLGFEQRISFEEGIRRTIDWRLNHPDFSRLQGVKQNARY